MLPFFKKYNLHNEINKIFSNGQNGSVITKKTCTTPKNTYYVLNYNKTLLHENDEHTRVFRSVVVSLCKNILCFSPPKSLSFNTFGEKYSLTPTPTNNIQINDVIEGTMINLWYDFDINSWEISSKTSVGCNYFFYRNQYPPLHNTKNTTFLQMFLDALHVDRGTDLNDIELFRHCPKSCCYNFVSQHSENHIVLSVETPRIFLVQVFFISEKECKIYENMLFSTTAATLENSVDITTNESVDVNDNDVIQHKFSVSFASEDTETLVVENSKNDDDALFFWFMQKASSTTSSTPKCFFEHPPYFFWHIFQ